MAANIQRQYDLVLLGATGYTGKLCAEHIATHLPTDLKWAVAGRSGQKLETLVDELKTYNADRLRPSTRNLCSKLRIAYLLIGVEIASLGTEDLSRLAKTTRIILNTIGPYHLYSTPVVDACARNGTHYLDVTGESPWVLEMIEKYDSMARANGAIIIPEIGFESAPSDMMAWSLASLFREEYSLPTREVICTLHLLKGTPSGGTLATILSILDHYSLKVIGRSTAPWAMSPIPGPSAQIRTSWISRLFGVRWVPQLGVLTTSLFGPTDTAIVQRSWGLLDNGEYYGPNFQYSEYLTAYNAFVAVTLHFAFALSLLALTLRPVRWLVRKFIYAPGQGIHRDYTRNEVTEFRAIATADEDTDYPKQASARLRYDGGNYYFTGLLLAEAAMVILQEPDIAQRHNGGVLTPAVLGQAFSKPF